MKIKRIHCLLQVADWEEGNLQSTIGWFRNPKLKGLLEKVYREQGLDLQEFRETI